MVQGIACPISLGECREAINKYGGIKMDELRKRNRSVVEKFYELGHDANVLFADNGVKIIPWYPPNGISWTGRNKLDQNFQSNKSYFPDFNWDEIRIFETDDPNYFWVECSGRGEQIVSGKAEIYMNQYINSFLIEDGQIKEFREFFSPLNLYNSFGIEVSPLMKPPFIDE